MMRRIGDIIDTQTKKALCAVHGDYSSENSLRIGWSPCLKCAEEARKASILAAVQYFNKNQTRIAGEQKKRATGKIRGRRND